MFTLNCKGKLFVINQPIVMGIINVTPDSFYHPSRTKTIDLGLAMAEKMVSEGALILDIGGQSTRPGSIHLSQEEELVRVIPIMDAIYRRFPDTLISVDTFHSKVAKEAIFNGASLINDVSSGQFDKEMMATVSQYAVPFICMHRKGNFETMHSNTIQGDVIEEVLDYFINKVAACSLAGIKDLILDPGFGFSKSVEQNFAILKNLDAFSILKKPILLGVSRKSTIYKTLGITVEEALNGTTVLHTAGLLKGASILRVHDVKEAIEAIKLTSYLI